MGDLDKGGCPRRRGGPGPICSGRLRKPTCISVLLAWGSNAQRLATPESAGSLRHSSGGVNRAWGEGQKPATPAGGSLPLPDTSAHGGVPQDRGLARLPSPVPPHHKPPGRPWWPWGGGIRRCPPGTSRPTLQSDWPSPQFWGIRQGLEGQNSTSGCRVQL